MTILDYERQISKLEAIAENAVVEANFYTVQESAAYDECDYYSLNEAAKKKNGFINTVKNALSKAWQKFLEFIRKVKRKVAELFGQGTFAQEDIPDLCNAVYSGKLNSKLNSYIGVLFKMVTNQKASTSYTKAVKNSNGEFINKTTYKIDKNQKDLIEIKNKLNKLLDEEGKTNRTIKENQSTKHVYKLIEQCEHLVGQIYHWVDKRAQAGDLNGFCTDMLSLIREYLNKVIVQCERVARSSSMNNGDSKRYANSVENKIFVSRQTGGIRAAADTNERELKDYTSSLREKGKQSQTESAGVLAAQCLIEAARLLNEEGEADDLSDAYSLPLTSETDGPSYDEIDDIGLSQKDIELDDEYPTDASGGEGQEISMDEIEDLCDGDKEAMDLLTDGEGSEIIDAGKSISESIFSFNF